MDQLAHVMTAISHPTRRAILARLSKGPARFSDIAEPFDTALNSVTKHLKLLERAGLIDRKRKGREVFISFRAAPLQKVASWVHEYERFWTEHLDEFQKHFANKSRKEKSDEHDN
jgi:DNA-binding transcriptional ArsR family regulator